MQTLPTEYTHFLGEIKTKIRRAQYEAMKAVNTNLVRLYWEIGQSISEKQKLASWGKSVVENLAKDLQAEFPGIRGFSTSNLWYMSKFYDAYHQVEFLQSLIGEISWTHHTIIFSKCKDNRERQFYIAATKKFGWTSRVLTHQIENKSFEKYLLNQTNFDEVVPEKYRNQAVLAVKDHYLFDFLELADDHSEHELELALLKNIRRFLLEMGQPKRNQNLTQFDKVGLKFGFLLENQNLYLTKSKNHTPNLSAPRLVRVNRPRKWPPNRQICFTASDICLSF
jgi:predicted nuclease of restriction endonuclease-like (RecB) superfamily